METWYDKEEDILNIELDDAKYWKSVELPNGVVFDISKNGKITAIEILGASKLLRGDAKKIIEQAKIVAS